jgi:hypothetical protein
MILTPTARVQVEQCFEARYVDLGVEEPP